MEYLKDKKGDKKYDEGFVCNQEKFYVMAMKISKPKGWLGSMNKKIHSKKSPLYI